MYILFLGHISGNESNYNRYWLLGRYFVFNVILIFADIATDIYTAVQFFKSGDYNWGMFTILVIFAPLGARIIMIVFNSHKCFLGLMPDESKTFFRRFKWEKNDARIAAHWKELKKLFWSIPLFHPVG